MGNSPNWQQFGLFSVWRLGKSGYAIKSCMGAQSCAVCHAHQGVAPCTRLQRSRNSDHILNTLRAAARLFQHLLHQPPKPSSTTSATLSARRSTGCCASSCGSSRKLCRPTAPARQIWTRLPLHIGAVALLHRFGSRLNGHVHFHVCVVDGVFEEVAGCVSFHPASAIGCHRRAPPRQRYVGVLAPNSPLRPVVAARGTSSRSSRTVPTSGTHSITSGWSQSPRTSLRHAGHPRGIAVMRRWARVLTASQIGTWRNSPLQPRGCASASIGDSAKRRFRQRRGATAYAAESNPLGTPRSGH